MNILIKFTLFDVKAHTISKGFIFYIDNIIIYSPKKLLQYFNIYIIFQRFFFNYSKLKKLNVVIVLTNQVLSILQHLFIKIFY